MTDRYTKERIKKAPPPDRPHLEPPRKPVETLHWVGEPERLCGNCEHYDGGGLGKNNWPREASGDCHNGISGKLQTSAKSAACKRGFYPCSTRWPIHERLKGKWAI
jgi:hypothetical protein